MVTLQQRLARRARVALAELGLDCELSTVTETPAPSSGYALRFVDRTAAPEARFFWIDLAVDDDTDDAVIDGAIRERLLDRGREAAQPPDGHVAARFDEAVRAADVAARARRRARTLGRSGPSA